MRVATPLSFRFPPLEKEYKSSDSAIKEYRERQQQWGALLNGIVMEKQ